MGRRPSTGKINPSQILIYTEGETEKIYLECLKNILLPRDRKSIKIKKLGKQGLSLFDSVNNILKNNNSQVSPVEVYIVVDKDDTKIEDLIKLRKKCLDKEFKLIFSNECFELWLLFHFEKVTSYMSRSDLIKRLTKWIEKDFKKTDIKVLSKIAGLYTVAIENASGIDCLNDDNLCKNPYTNVKELIFDVFVWE